MIGGSVGMNDGLKPIGRGMKLIGRLLETFSGIIGPWFIEFQRMYKGFCSEIQGYMGLLKCGLYISLMKHKKLFGGK